MRFKNIFTFSLPVLSLLAISCTDNDDSLPYAVPTTYTFERNGSTTVDHSGQSNRILMLGEMGDYIKNQASVGATVDVAKLTAMYSNTNNPFSNSALNTSGKLLKDKTAASRDYFVNLEGGGSITEQTQVRAMFEASFTEAYQASLGANANVGVAGYYLDGSTKRLFSSNGLEPQQVLLKGLMGACFMDQIANNYLSTSVLDEGANIEKNTNKVLENGKNYTRMEHLWDEAYGYVYGAGGEKFWDSYINQVSADVDFKNVKAEINLAFRKGRAAIVANDYKTRNEQISIIRQKIALIPAVRAVFYLKDGQAKLGMDNGAKAFHSLSEAYGFIMSLRYTNKPGTNNPYFTKTEVATMLATLTAGNNGFWDTNYLNPKLDLIAAQIAAKFGFTVAQAATVN